MTTVTLEGFIIGGVDLSRLHLVISVQVLEDTLLVPLEPLTSQPLSIPVNLSFLQVPV